MGTIYKVISDYDREEIVKSIYDDVMVSIYDDVMRSIYKVISDYDREEAVEICKTQGLYADKTLKYDMKYTAEFINEPSNWGLILNLYETMDNVDSDDKLSVSKKNTIKKLFVENYYHTHWKLRAVTEQKELEGRLFSTSHYGYDDNQIIITAVDTILHEMYTGMQGIENHSAYPLKVNEFVKRKAIAISKAEEFADFRDGAVVSFFNESYETLKKNLVYLQKSKAFSCDDVETIGNKLVTSKLYM